MNAENIVDNIDVSAEGLFMGCILNKEVTRWELCNCKIVHCADCGGKRIRSVTRTQQVTIPPLTRNGQQVIVRNGGHQAPKMNPGDLILTTVCQSNEIYHIVGNHLQLKQSIGVTLFDALGGRARTVLKDLDGTEFRLNFPFDLFRNGVAIVAGDNYGLPMGLGHRGKLFIRVVIEQPNYSGFRALEMKEKLQINLDVPLNAEDALLEYEH